jgi:hypothetical protein
MKKRGPILIITGIILIILPVSVTYSVVMPTVQSGSNGNNPFPFLESMFDNSTEKIRIEAGDAYTFSHTVNTGGVPLMWGLHIIDFKPDQSVSISISNIFGDKFGTFVEGEPVFIKSFIPPKIDTYSFKIENKGKEPITVIMLFTEDPEKSKALTDPNSPFVKTIIPLAIAGIVLIVGIIIMISGIILSIVDWRKTKNRSRYI